MQRALAGSSFLVSGLGVGWLVGLSTSPVVAAVIAALLTAILALTGSDVSPEVLSKRIHVAAGSMALLVAGVALGATGGLAYRTGTPPFADSAGERARDRKAQLDQWVALGVDKSDVLKRLLDRDLPRDRAGSAEVSSPANLPGGLVSMSADECTSLRSVAQSRVFAELAASPKEPVRKLGESALSLKLPDTFAATLREALCITP